MGYEIERKFLLNGALPDEFLNLVNKQKIKQAYLCLDTKKTIRIRTVHDAWHGDTTFLTVKGKAEGISRQEIESRILSNTAAAELMENFREGSIIEKTRYIFPVVGANGPSDKLKWEVDQFHGENEGLWLVEIELPSEDFEFAKPFWLGKEVSTDYRYTNAYLAKNPWTTWEG